MRVWHSAGVNLRNFQIQIPLQSRRDEMFIEERVPPDLQSRRDEMFISGCAFTHIVPTGLKKGCITFNYKHSVPTGLKRGSDIEYSLS